MIDTLPSLHYYAQNGIISGLALYFLRHIALTPTPY